MRSYGKKKCVTKWKRIYDEVHTYYIQIIFQAFLFLLLGKTITAE